MWTPTRPGCCSESSESSKPFASLPPAVMRSHRGVQAEGCFRTVLVEDVVLLVVQAVQLRHRPALTLALATLPAEPLTDVPAGGLGVAARALRSRSRLSGPVRKAAGRAAAASESADEAARAAAAAAAAGDEDDDDDDDDDGAADGAADVGAAARTSSASAQRAAGGKRAGRTQRTRSRTAENRRSVAGLRTSRAARELSSASLSTRACRMYWGKKGRRVG